MYGLTTFEQVAIWSVLGVAILGLLYAVFLRSQILREDKGTAKMLEVWNAIREGADAYLRRQLRSILPLIAILTIALFASVYVVPPSREASEWYCMAKMGSSLCRKPSTVPSLRLIWVNSSPFFKVSASTA